jgi:hypothetical protein
LPKFYLFDAGIIRSIPAYQGALTTNAYATNVQAAIQARITNAVATIAMIATLLSESLVAYISDWGVPAVSSLIEFLLQ